MFCKQCCKVQVLEYGHDRKHRELPDITSWVGEREVRGEGAPRYFRTH